ncbi:acyl carrier protein [Parabacteroides sp. 20_3]|mgnify:FL=1|jgi:acyl carrier protein|uniref:acyl carrier protein n=1 Tax=Parabacteroides sp. 20_3 TaxID=469591 RepID=UPI000EBEFC5A|nr:acyl carrier protein [Parabacteroides sp. 20_3]RGK69131.1 acyl carrier protein [Parabacteroides sp. 20_3]
MEEKILCVLKDVLGLESATKALSQQNCDKWDSLRHLNLIVELESEFSVEFEPEEIAEIKSFEDIKRLLKEKNRLEL